MKLYVVSDLHNEFGVPFKPPQEAIDAADVIVLPGDIDLGTDALAWARDVFGDKRILCVAGNHEYYGYDFDNLEAELRRVAKEFDIDFLENDAVVFGGLRFLGCALWTDFELFGADRKDDAAATAARGITDFSIIRRGKKRFNPWDAIAKHQASRQWLEERLAEPFAGKTVVITHHLPSMQSVSAWYQQQLLSAAFASDLDTLVAQADMWIHGHTHDSFDYSLGKCRVICNPRGYQRPGDMNPENTDFNPGLLVEVGP